MGGGKNCPILKGLICHKWQFGRYGNPYILKLKNNTIKDISPLNILRKGYSLVYSNGKIANQTADFEIDGELKIKVVDGEVHSSVRKIKKN